jgi:hypothetical protein
MSLRTAERVSMTNNDSQQSFTFGEFVAAVFSRLEAASGAGIVRLAANARLIEFLGRERFVISAE